MTSPAPARWRAQRRLQPCLTPGRLAKSRAASLEKTSYLAPAAVHSLDRAGEAVIGSCQLHEAWMDHYLTQAASKEKRLKFGSGENMTKIRQWREHDRLHRGMGA